MKVLACADSHGNPNQLNTAKKLKDLVDHIVFLGDYCDSHNPDYTWIEQKRVLSDILEFKHSEPDGKVVTLFGNHDLTYMTKYGASTISSRQWFSAAEIQLYLDEHFKEFLPLVVFDKWIFSHAGVSRKWLECPDGRKQEDFSLEDVVKAFKEKRLDIFNHNGFDPYGDSPTEGCMWIRPPSLMEMGVEGFNQVVGHTPVEDGGEEFWGLPGRIVGDEKRTFVFLDSVDQNRCAIIDTLTNEIKIEVCENEN